MLQAFLLLAWVWSGVLSPLAGAESLVGADLSAEDFIFSPPPSGTKPQSPGPPQLPLIAGRPFEEAQAVLGRHGQELIHLPGANGVSMDSEGIIVYTTNPAAVPPFVEGLPVRAMPPLPGGPLPGSKEASGALVTGAQEETAPPAERECSPEAFWDAPLGLCRAFANVTSPGPDPNLLPPPPGVIILRPGGIREQADACPGGFNEHVSLGGWRFCLDPKNPEPIPPLMAPPIAGIAYEEALKILERHREELMKLPGVESVGLDAEGIRVEAKTPPPGLPAAVEGLPVRAVAPSGGPLIGASHTFNTQVRPLHGGVALADKFAPQLGGTLTTVGLFQGKPWLIFPSHLLATCSVGGPPDQPCPVGTSLTTCSNHYGGTVKITQPIGTVPEDVGFVQRWDILQTGVNTSDAALAFMDNDTVEGNGSLSANRALEIWGPFSGVEAIPVVSPTATVTVVNIDPTNSGTHIKPARVTAVGQTRNVSFNCRGQGSPAVPLISQTDLQATGTVCFSPGDSGSPVLNSAGEIIGTFNWIDSGSATCTGGGRVRGGGTSASTVRQVLGFDRWYGTLTVTDNTIGVFRPSNASWYVDNGNGKWDGPCSGAAPIATRDQCFGYGWGTDVPVTGDWDNAALGFPSNDFTVGVYRPTTNPTYFYLSNRNDVPAVNITMAAGPSSFGYKPVSGKWRGNNGASNATSKVGVFRPSTGGWYLDSGNNFAEGCGTDYCFFLAAGLYQAGDIPIAGDWNNDGIVSIGVFRPGSGSSFFYLSNVDPYTVRNNNYIFTWDYTVAAGLASFGYLPIVGDWTGTGGSKLGIFRPSTGGWYLDNGNRVFPGCAEDQCPTFGLPGDKPVAFGKSIVRGN